MRTYELTINELLYLSAIAGIPNIWGVRDPYKDSNLEDISKDVIRMQESLLRKHMAASVLDSGFSVDKQLRDTLRFCDHCETVYILSSSFMEESNDLLRFYVEKSRIVKLSVAESKVQICNVSRSEFKDIVLSFFGECDSARNTDSFVASSSRMKRLGSLSRRRFIEELRQIGCQDDFSLLLADGLQGESEFCSLLAFQRNNSEEKLTGKIVAIHFPSGSLMVKPIMNVGNDSVCFTRLSHESLEKEVMAIIASTGKDEGDMNA